MDETRKNRVIVTTRTLRALLFLSLSTRLRTRWRGEGSIRRIITVETFTPFGIPWEKHSIPERRKCGEAKERERERKKERPSPSEASKRAGARASSFSISAPLCPFHRGPSSAKRLADCSYCPRRNGLLGFPSGFLHPVSPSVFPT